MVYCTVLSFAREIIFAGEEFTHHHGSVVIRKQNIVLVVQYDGLCNRRCCRGVHTVLCTVCVRSKYYSSLSL